MIFSKKHTVGADDLQAVLKTIPGVTPRVTFKTDHGTDLLLFVVAETPEGWNALRLLRTVTMRDEPDGSERTASLALGGSDAHNPDCPLLWKLECCSCCGLTPGEIMEALEAHGYGPVEPADEEVES